MALFHATCHNLPGLLVDTEKNQSQVDTGDHGYERLRENRRDNEKWFMRPEDGPDIRRAACARFRVLVVT